MSEGTSLLPIGHGVEGTSSELWGSSAVHPTEISVAGTPVRPLRKGNSRLPTRTRRAGPRLQRGLWVTPHKVFLSTTNRPHRKGTPGHHQSAILVFNQMRGVCRTPAFCIVCGLFKIWMPFSKTEFILTNVICFSISLRSHFTKNNCKIEQQFYKWKPAR